MGESSPAVEVVNVSRKLVGKLPRGEYSTDMFPTTRIAVKAIYRRSHSTEHDRTLRLESDYNTGGAPFESVAVLNESGQGK